MEDLEFKVSVVEVTTSQKSLSKGDTDINKVVLEGELVGNPSVEVKVSIKSEDERIDGFALKQGFKLVLVPLDQKLDV
ncbi:hypothetical protein [Archaeoglobus profundus]|uniref:Uncharacterized protein n=1 Tax=Archaeoglobus profundus (strain DSM 5631 / JCM 9629 / NBRC 100127 / Av18) TaxID=572546 RepID=D2REM0_ARCPA|nr:hypothetical protein [Archaeoglobus profundus]ADB58564.1 hypothetical protein Arcpr_1518 [Archaeoglobus profundus DSM 5631]